MSKTMNQEQKLQLSALVDNEESVEVMVQVGRRLSDDTELRKTLVRYQLISDGLRGEDINIRSLDIVSAVSKKLEDEPTILAPTATNRRWQRWAQPAIGAALAASVAAVGIVFGPALLQREKADIPRLEGPVVAQPLPVAVQPVALADRTLATTHQDAPGARWKTLADNPQANERMRTYLEQHSRYAAPGGMPGVMPYASFVSYNGHVGSNR